MIGVETLSDDEPAGSVTLEINNRVAWVSFANPGKRNAFTWRMYDQLARISAQVNDTEGLAAVVFRGSPEDGFAAGTDIRQFVDFASGADGVQYEERVARVLATLLAISVPAIALVEGAAVGAGLAIAACCDVIVAERGAVFGAPIARRVGNCLPSAVVARLRSRMGAGRATAMLMTSSLVPAEDLLASGFVHLITERGGLDDAAEEVLRRMRTSAPLTLRALKEINRRLDGSTALPNVDDLLELCYGSADFHEGVRAFVDQRHPDWRGR